MVSRSRRQSANHSHSEHPSKKQKTADKALEDFFNETIEKLLALSDGDYRISIDFSTLPSKTEYPDYYKEIQNPISIKEIKQKISSHSYTSTDDFIADFQLMADNAIQFNEEDSDIAQNALKLLETVKQESLKYNKTNEQTPVKATPKIKLRVGHSKNEPVSKLSPLEEDLNNIIEELIAFKENDVEIAVPFLQEVDREEYPDYYQLIKKAMALETVQQKIKDHKYTNLDQFIDDVELIWKNAQTYNEEGSLIYEDSVTLQNFFKEKVGTLKAPAESPKKEEDNDDDEETKSIPQASDAEESLKSKEQTPTPAEQQPEVPVKRKVGRPKGRPPKPKVLPPVVPLESEDILNQELGENLLEANLFGDSYDHSKFQTQPVIQKKPIDPVILDTIEAIPTLLKTFSEIPKHKPASEALIQDLTISSSRSIYRQTVNSTQLFHNWFQYQFRAVEKKPDSYAITLSPSAHGAISVSAGLNDSLFQTKHSAFLTVNGERVNPTPSIHYAETGRQITSRYELKLAPGLNLVVFEVKLDVPSDRIDAVSDKLSVWVQVL